MLRHPGDMVDIPPCAVRVFDAHLKEAKDFMPFLIALILFVSRL